MYFSCKNTAFHLPSIPKNLKCVIVYLVLQSYVTNPDSKLEFFIDLIKEDGREQGKVTRLKKFDAREQNIFILYLVNTRIKERIFYRKSE